MKTCTKCIEVKNLDCFYHNKKNNSLRSQCKKCINLAASIHRKNNPRTKNRMRAEAKKFRDANPDYYKNWRLKNINKERARGKIEAAKWRKKYPGLNCEKKMREHAIKLQAMPKWLTVEQKKEIKNIYKNRPAGFHVDHIIPLRGKEVKGLHVPWNLQYLPALENLSKNNKVYVK